MIMKINVKKSRCHLIFLKRCKLFQSFKKTLKMIIKIALKRLDARLILVSETQIFTVPVFNSLIMSSLSSLL